MTPEELWQICRDVPSPQPIFYRLYYDNAGLPVCYSMEDLAGNYIEIDQTTYVRSSKWVRVRDGRLYDYRPWLHARKLIPGTSGTACYRQDIMIVDHSNTSQTWRMHTYDQD
jgi:hypothetical protein